MLRTTKNGLLTTISGYYTTEEILEAKTKLFETTEKLRANGCEINGKHRLVRRKMSDNKRKLDTEDILNLFSDLDAAGILLPAFTSGRQAQKRNPHSGLCSHESSRRGGKDFVLM